MKAPWEMDFTLRNLLYVYKRPAKLQNIFIYGNCSWCIYSGKIRDIPFALQEYQVIEFTISRTEISVKLEA